MMRLVVSESFSTSTTSTASSQGSRKCLVGPLRNFHYALALTFLSQMSFLPTTGLYLPRDHFIISSQQSVKTYLLHCRAIVDSFLQLFCPARHLLSMSVSIDRSSA